MVLSLVRALLVASTLHAPADGLRGTVTDSAGAPLAAAQVIVVELDRGTVTGADGGFIFEALPAGHYTLLVRRLGFAAISVPVTVPSDPFNVRLRAAAAAVNPVTVTATRAPLKPSDSPLPADVLGGETLRREQSVSLARALDNVAGVRDLATGAQVGKPVIRGLSGARVLVLEDGHRLEDYSWSTEDGPSVDGRLADRIEVIRGPASVEYGSDAIGGVVNVVPEPFLEAPPNGSVTRMRTEVYGAANNLELGSALRLDHAQGSFAERAFFVGRYAGDVHTPEGALDNTGFFALNGEGAVGVHGARGSAALRFARYAGEFHLLEANGPPPGGAADQGPERKLADDRLQFTGNYLAGGVRLEGKAHDHQRTLAER